MLSIRLHNILDYVIGAVLIVTPYIFGFADNAPMARSVFVVLGVLLIGYSLLTNYSYSIAKVIPLKVHMVFDVLTGVFIMLAPTIYGYRPVLTGFQNALHWIFGLGAILLVAVTKRAFSIPGATSEIPEDAQDRKIRRVA